MSDKIKTSEIPDAKGSGQVKILQPGNAVIKINGISTKKVPYEGDPLEIILSCEGEPVGGDFEGFDYDKDKPELGKALGRVGQIRAQQYPFKDGMAGKKVLKRQDDMLAWIMNFCKAIDKSEWLKTQGDFDTVEELVAHIDTYKPFKDIWLMSCIGGRGYINNKGFLNYDLFLPWFNTNEVPLEMLGVQPSKVWHFNKEKHIINPKKKTETIEGFTGTKSAPELDL